MKLKNITMLAFALIFLSLPVMTHASAVSDMQENKFLENTASTSTVDTNSAFDKYMNAEHININTNNISDIQFICNEIKNKTTLKNMIEDRNNVAELAVSATNISHIHNNYEPAAEKANTLNRDLAEIDRHISEYAKIIQNQAFRVMFQFNSSYSSDTALAVKQLEDMEKRINHIKNRSEQIDLHVDCFYGFHDLPQIRKDLVNTAFLLEGQITYEWGSKPANAGWNKKWDKEGTGLDCSGFIEWVYWTTIGKSNKSLRSTLAITDTQKQISYEELLPGDLGTILTEGSYYIDYAGKKYYSEDAAKQANEAAGHSADDIVTYSNHVGIYVGKDKKGNDIWCHCQGSDVKTVTVGPFEKFVNYYRMPDLENIK